MKSLIYYIRKLTVYSVFILLLCITGCIDDPVIPQGSINGTVYDVYNIQNPYTLVSVGEYPVIGVDGLGKFTIENVSMPFNLDISQFRGSTTKYLGLNSNNINVFEYYNFGSAQSCLALVTYPMLENKSKRVLIKFISEGVCNQFDAIFHYPDTLAAFNVYIPLDKSSISGKFVYLEMAPDEYGNIASYDKFGVKSVILYPSIPNNPWVNFSQEDISFNPPEEIVPYEVIAGKDQNTLYTKLYLSFTGTHRNSDTYLYTKETSLSGMFVVPVLEKINYKLMISSVYGIENPNNGREALGEKWVYVNPGEEALITFETSPRLEEPANNQGNINDESIFKIADEEPPGIYVYYFSSNDGELSVYTDKKSLKFKELKSRNFTFLPNTQYFWGVRKYPGYSSIDQFATMEITSDVLYSSIPVSVVNSFKTAP